MKKMLLLLSMVAGGALVAQTDPVFVVQTGTAAGSYPSGHIVEDGAAQSGWAYADMSDPVNAITDTIVLAYDGSDSLCCNGITNGVDVAGQIAVIYRGDCEFGDKAFNAQQAGATGVLIISNSDDVIRPSGGTQGMNVTIPVWTISKTNGATVRASMDNDPDPVVVFFGNKDGAYANDVRIGTFIGGPAFAVKPQQVVQDAGDISIASFYTQVDNPGTAANDVYFIAQVFDTDGTTVLFADTSDTMTVQPNDYVNAAIEDTVELNAPGTFVAAANELGVGRYMFKYEIHLVGATDEWDNDNIYESYYEVSEDKWSYAVRDADDSARGTTGYPLTLQGSIDAQYCAAFVNESAGDLAVTGLNFAAFNNDGIAGEFISYELYSWNDNFTTMFDGQGAWLDMNNYTDFFLLGIASYAYTNDAESGIEVTAPLENLVTPNTPVVLDNNQRYLVCNSLLTNPNLYVLFQTAGSEVNSRDYTLNIVEEDITINPFYNATDGWGWTGPSASGWIGGGIPIISLNTIDASTVSASNENITTLNAYPNPAVDHVNVSMAGKTGAATLNVVDLQGKVVMTTTTEIANNGVTLNTSALQSGSYIVTVEFNDGTTSTVNVVVAK